MEKGHALQKRHTEFAYGLQAVADGRVLATEQDAGRVGKFGRGRLSPTLRT